MDNGVSGAKVSRRSIHIETVMFGFVEAVCEGIEIRQKESGSRADFILKSNVVIKRLLSMVYGKSVSTSIFHYSQELLR